MKQNKFVGCKRWLSCKVCHICSFHERRAQQKHYGLQANNSIEPINKKYNFLIHFSLTASPQKGRPSPPAAQSGRESSQRDEDYSDEEVHSDDEFNFIEDNEVRRPPLMLGKKPVGSFAVTIQGQNIRSNPSSPTDELDSNQAGDMRTDDFVKMMSDFKGFGTSCSPNLPSPPKPIPMIQLDAGGSDVSSAPQTGSEDATSGNSSTVNEVAGNTAVAPGQESEVSRSLDTETDRVGVEEGESEYHGLVTKENEFPATSVSASTDRVGVEEGESEYQGLVTKENEFLATSVSASTPEYVTVLSSEDPRPRTPDSDDNSIIRDDSFSVFTPRRSAVASQVTQQPSQAGAAKKLENLKPKLKYPILLVSAGEGHADLRRKVPDGNDKEPRVMIWQMS